MYKMCLLQNEEESVNKFIKAEHIQLGRKIKHSDSVWEIRGVCSAIVSHNDMVSYVEKYRSEDDGEIHSEN